MLWRKKIWCRDRSQRFPQIHDKICLRSTKIRNQPSWFLHSPPDIYKRGNLCLLHNLQVKISNNHLNKQPNNKRKTKEEKNSTDIFPHHYIRNQIFNMWRSSTFTFCSCVTFISQNLTNTMYIKNILEILWTLQYDFKQYIPELFASKRQTKELWWRNDEMSVLKMVEDKIVGSKKKTKSKIQA